MSIYRVIKSKLTHIITLLLCSLVLCACSGEKCIDADDFGFSSLTIPARSSGDDITTLANGLQVNSWIDSGYQLNGRPLTILVRTWNRGSDENSQDQVSAWCPWYGSNVDGRVLSNFCSMLSECTFPTGTCSESKNINIESPPCLMKNGMGLYALVTKKNPNFSYLTQMNPEGLTIHLGDKLANKMYSIDNSGVLREAGGIIYKFPRSIQDSNGQTVASDFAYSNLYFKILDKYYDDNSGQYRILIKSGIYNNDGDIIGSIKDIVMKTLFGSGANDLGIIRKIYSNLANNSQYKMAVGALLTLYVIYSALSFLTGNLNMTKTEFLIRIIKIAIVATLTTGEASWSFFNNYVFVYFTDGLQQILTLINQASSGGPGSNSIIGLMMAPQTMAKLFSLLLAQFWSGIVYIILFFVALIYIIIVTIEATILYLSALLTIGIIITMAPIFLCFMLFDITRSLFDNWLKQMISYAIQPIILFAGLGIVTMLIRHHIYAALGFAVCKYSIFPNETWSKYVYWWHPKAFDPELKKLQKIPVPEDHILDSPCPNDNCFCEAYGCIDDRYVELPFLDPVKDASNIADFFNNDFVQFSGLFLIFAIIYLMRKFNSISSIIANALAGNIESGTNIGGAANNFSSTVNTAISKYAGKTANKYLSGITTAFKRSKAGQLMAALSEKRKAEKIAKLKKEAIKNVDPAVLEEVKRETGLTRSGINDIACIDYSESIKDTLRELKIPDASVEKYTNILKNNTYPELKDALAKIKYNGKKFDELTPAEKKEITNLAEKKPSKLELESKLQDATTQRDKIKNELSKAEKDLADLKQQTLTPDQELEKQARIDRAKLEFDKTKLALENNAQELKKDVESATLKLEQSKDKKDPALQKILDDAKQKLSNAENEIQDHVKKAADINNDPKENRLKDIISEKKQALTKANQEFVQRDRENTKLLSITETRNKLNIKTLEVNNLKSEIANLEKVSKDPNFNTLSPEERNAHNDLIREAKIKLNIAQAQTTELDASCRSKLKRAFAKCDPTLTDLELQKMVDSKKALDKVQAALASKALNSNKDYGQLLSEEATKLTVRELADEARKVRDFQDAYVSASHKLDAEGLGIISRRIPFLKRRIQSNNKLEQYKAQEQNEKIYKMEKRYAGYEGIKNQFLTKAFGKKIADTLTNDWTGIQASDPRRMTYSEALVDKQRNIEYNKLKNQIEYRNKTANADVLSPEYLIRSQDQSLHTLSKKMLSEQIYNELSNAQVIMGDKFMREKATQNQSKNMINKANKIEKNLLNNDKYIRQEETYRIAMDKANDTLNKQYENIKKQNPDKNITIYNMNNFVQNQALREEIAIAYFEISRNSAMLNIVEARKAQIKQEITKYVNDINQYRENAGMEAYNPKGEEKKD